MAADEKPAFTIVGAGLAGPLMATYLARAGHPVELYEKRPDPRTGRADTGRSINLALSTRGIHALEQVGAAAPVLATATPMRGRLMHAVDGTLTYQPYGTTEDQVINAVSRRGLNEVLLDVAESQPDVRIHFDHTCTGIDLETATLRVRDNATGEVREVACERVVAADGAFSVVRGAMQVLDRFDYQQMYLRHGYKELVIPAGPDGQHVLEKNVLHIWPRGTFMLIALANQDGSFTCTLFWPFEGPASFAALQEPGEVRRFFARMFPDVAPLMPNLVEEYLQHPTSSLVTIRCFPWHYQDKAVLLGDACHAVVPFYGQGMNAAFEDCDHLSRCLADHEGDVERAFEAYGRLRKPNVDALSDLALENFVEMRDRVASRYFLFKKRLGKVLHRLLPNRFVPLYTMVTFTNLPYAEAVRRAERQSRLVAALVLGAVVLVVNLFIVLMFVLLSR